MSIGRLLSPLLVCFALASQAAETKPVKVFLLAGQSNMAGFAPAADLKPPLNEPFEPVKIWWTKASMWSAVSPVGRTNIGPEITFARSIASLLPGEEIRLIKHAKSGTSLWKDWSPDTNGPHWARFLSVADPALADLEKSGIKYELAGMLWLQGESDAQDGKGAEYEANLRNFIAKVREHFKAPDLPFIIARVRDYFGRENGNAELVREAEVKVAESTKNAGWFDTDDCSMLSKPPGHYDTEGQAIIGRRFAETYVKTFAKAAH